ncbi:nuclear transport factor 2 family protein [Leifsonia poae]|uniref:nuclear transport factor 2 family protein n=1 Tax=Leifsonia poae TaxID=110933 RepID=UPI001CC0A626|nr:nuclear transport factor 2 family protein [Leifsonia poae]
MSNLQTLADHVELLALQAEFTDAGMQGDFDGFASQFTARGIWRIPGIGVEFVGREQIRAGIERLKESWEFFVQTAHPGVIELSGDTARGRVYIAEFGRLRDGGSHSNHAIYHDRYERTEQGWRFAARSYEVRYMDTAPLTGSPPQR